MPADVKGSGGANVAGDIRRRPDGVTAVCADVVLGRLAGDVAHAHRGFVGSWRVIGPVGWMSARWRCVSWWPPSTAIRRSMRAARWLRRSNVICRCGSFKSSPTANGSGSVRHDSDKPWRAMHYDAANLRPSGQPVLDRQIRTASRGPASSIRRRWTPSMTGIAETNRPAIDAARRNLRRRDRPMLAKRHVGQSSRTREHRDQRASRCADGRPVAALQFSS
ncbi:hypothetical protein LAUMK35_05031 [Mycobacterium pseudokansasii]|uniref:Uncharacterized protein n=1 Tax=Mycobacterium pseudokansasii TaxID=2341080 RepID=A0A498QZL2_9MYCO|nr:hypothetical protein LAUMK35_05031 [Mycobacterium pseudokansasii]VBA33350.1 hypothetical protein LAUMK21_04990 [Mycobacterium pseudokansasii]VBA55112.1 hypothetical protein LAUMK142_04958 [Mycobacterium pseudokansasii]